MKWARVAVVCMAFCLIACASKAQVVGVVSDGFGNPLGNVEVSIAGMALKTTTNEGGKYSIRYVPGKFAIHFTKEGYTEFTANQDVSVETTVPLERVVLYKLPSEQGAWFFGANDYVPLKIGRLNLIGGSRSTFQWVYDMTYQVFGEYTRIPQAESYRFLDTHKAKLILLKVGDDNVVAKRREAFSGIGDTTAAAIKDNWKEIAPKVGVRQVSLQPGRYAYVALRNRDAFGFGPEDLVSPVFLFEVGSANLAASGPPAAPVEGQAVWDKALEAGEISFVVYRERFGSSQKGSLRLTPTEVSFIDQKGQKIFAIPPSDISSSKVFSTTPVGISSEWLEQHSLTLDFIPGVGLSIAGKNYNFEPFPLQAGCELQASFVLCPEPGRQQQSVIANYVAQTIPKLASGGFTKTAQPPAAAGTTGTAVVPGGALGPFRHGTLVMKVGPQALELAPTPAQATNTHVGVDLVGSCGTTPIHAFADGVVEDLIDTPTDSNFNALGYMVLVRHNEQIGGRETRSIYLHMDQKPRVGIGENVRGGSTILGLVGQTGAAQGCHTHFEIRHFAGRLLQDPGWNDPANIYGKGDQRSTARFRDNWEDPETISRQYSRPLI